MRIPCVLLLLVGFATGAFAQTTVSDFDGMTPVGLQPGSPAGSYGLSGLDTVNLYSGSANLTIPLLKIDGRGEAGYTMVIGYDAHWTGTGVLNTSGPCSSSPCWTLTKGISLAEVSPYSPASVAIRHLGHDSYTVYVDGYPQCNINGGTLTRITVGLSDGTEMTLVDQLTGGSPMGPVNPSCNNERGFDRGTTFISTDGSAATFIADTHIYDAALIGSSSITGETASGTLYLRDGRQFRFGDHSLDGYPTTTIDWIQDRNGNRTTFDYPATAPSGFQYGFSVTDSIGRITNVSVGQLYTFDDPNAGCYGCIGRFDQIKYTGAASQPRTITVYRRGYWYDRKSSLQDTPPPTFQTLFGGYASPSLSPFDWAISRIVLPDNHSYEFHYTEYGELARLDLPTGGHYEFDWVNGPGVDQYDICPSNPELRCPIIRAPYTLQRAPYDLLFAVYRRLSERREYVDSGATWTRKTTYSVTEVNAAVSGDPLGRCGIVGNPTFESGFCSQVTVNDFDPVQGQFSSQVHYFYGAVSPSQNLFPQSGWYSLWLEGKEFRSDVIQPGDTTLRQQLQTWQYRAIPAWWSSNSGPLPALDARLGSRDVIIDGGKMGRKLFAYSSAASDNTNNIVNLWEYDYGPNGTQGPLIRRTHTDYHTGYNNPAGGTYLRDLRTNQIVYDGSGNIVAQAQYGYDEAGVAAAPGISQNVLVGSQRGNLTHLSRWRNTDGVWLTTNNSFDIAGNVVSVQNPRGYSTSYTYTDCSGKYAFVTTVSKPLTGHTTTFGHDCVLAAVTSIADAAGSLTTVQYGNAGQDVLDRISRIIRPSGQQTTFIYSPDLTTVTTKSDQYSVGDQLLISAATNDGLGRTVETRLYKSPTNYISTRKDLDALGRTRTAYNPDSTSDGTTYVYDALGRIMSTTFADGSHDIFQWSGDTLLHTDPAAKQRSQQTDVLGRVTAVTEDPFGQNLLTSYRYDELDDLITVIQGAQTRSFVYDSLQLLRATMSPEVGGVISCLGQTVSECYSYDANGNLSSKTASGAQTTLTYDPLDRISTRTYTDSTLPVTYTYDSVQRGCLTSVGNGVGTITFTTYNPNCVITGSRETAGGRNYDFSYAYNLASELTEETYPSGRIVSYRYDAAGRTDRIGNGAITSPSSYATGITYAPHGAIASITFGVTPSNLGWIESWQYNNRLQPISITVAGNVLNLTFSYCPNGASACTTNNGNLQRQAITRNGTVWVQDYPAAAYDAMNRLTGAQETSASGAWTQSFGYDRYGNRWLASYAGLPAPNLETPQTQNWYLSNNRLAGWGYDGRGNITAIQNMPRTFSYDGENRQTSASINGASSTYSYDGEGHRITKTTGALTTNFVYDAFGHLAAEYSNQSPTGGTQYRHVDHLGSTRLITDSNGTPIQCHDFLPFGQEILSGIDGRGPCFPSTPSGGVEFTGKEHDMETGMDYFGARYFSAANGRFTSIDPSQFSVETQNPQSWNRYGYTYNNPLKYIDLNGKWPTAIHNAILAGAFSRGLADTQIKALQAGSFSVDFSLFGQMLTSRAHEHGTLGPDDTQEMARIKKDNFIFEHELAAEDAMVAAGRIDKEALKEMGKALHPVMDSLSPAHANRVFMGTPSSPLFGPFTLLMDAIGIWQHRGQEAKITLKEFHKAIDDVRREYLKTFGQEEFFKATRCNQVEGCPYSDLQLPQDLRP